METKKNNTTVSLLPPTSLVVGIRTLVVKRNDFRADVISVLFSIYMTMFSPPRRGDKGVFCRSRKRPRRRG